MLTSEQYAELSNPVCPFCGSDNIASSKDREVEFDLYYLYHPMECLNCGKLYWEKYELVGYEEA